MPPLDTLKKDELIALADAQGVDMTGATNNAERVQRLNDAGVDAPEDAERDPFYCPGCGRGYAYPAECVGMSPAQPHPPIQTVDSSELDGDPADHTPAPASE